MRDLFNQDKFGDVQGFVCKIARHPTFKLICNCNSSHGSYT